MGRWLRIPTIVTAAGSILAAACGARPDEFTVVDSNRQQETFEARLAGSGQGFFALEEPNGRMRIVSEAAIKDRETRDDPTPINAEAMVVLLEEKFGEDRIEAMIQEPYVAGDRACRTGRQAARGEAPRLPADGGLVSVQCRQGVRELRPIDAVSVGEAAVSAGDADLRAGFGLRSLRTGDHAGTHAVGREHRRVLLPPSPTGSPYG